MTRYNDSTMEEVVLGSEPRLPKPELREVERHQAHLSHCFGRDVSMDEALADWLCHHAAEWRADHQREVLARQREEMLRHKWIESEKAQRDLGNDAIFDWIRNHAAQWRAWHEHHYEPGLRAKDGS